MYYGFFKRLLDIFLALIGIVLTIPFYPFIALAIIIDSSGNIFYSSSRITKNGKSFSLYKLRSMKTMKIGDRIAQSDEILKRDKELLDKYKKLSYKLPNDPRITRVGRFLRKFSIDEWPQFFNILKGDMSIVGPRPYFASEIDEQIKIKPDLKKYTNELSKVKPGLTGLWQISGRNDIPFEERIKLEAHYVKQRSFLLDLEIILKTVPALFKGDGDR